jgi:hypothetical protein
VLHAFRGVSGFPFEDGRCFVGLVGDLGLVGMTILGAVAPCSKLSCRFAYVPCPRA